MARKHTQQGVPTGYVQRSGLKRLTSSEDLQSLLAGRRSLSVLRYDNPSIALSRFPFDYERAEEPKLEELREKYDLGSVVKGGKSEFDRMVLLRKWVNSRWTHGSPVSKNHARLDALQLLERASRGEKFFCHHFSLTFVQCCLALGWQARFVAINTSGPWGHSVAEVWSNQYKKWVLMDTDYNMHYLYNRVPQNVLDLHRLWLSTPKKASAVETVQADPEHKSPNLLNFYYHFRVLMGNAFFRADRRKWLTSKYHFVEWLDDHTLPAQWRDHHPHLFTKREEDLYWTLNITHIDLSVPKRGDCLKAHLNTVTPCFEGFEITVDGKTWRQTEHRFAWELHKGVNKLKVRSLNAWGAEAAPSTVSLRRR